MAIMKNLTPHDIHLQMEDGSIITIKPEAVPARCDSTEIPVFPSSINGINIPTVRRSWGKPVGLPEPEEGVILIVASVVLDHAENRTDLMAPDSGKSAVRDEKGQIKYCTRLIC